MKWAVPPTPLRQEIQPLSQGSFFISFSPIFPASKDHLLKSLKQDFICKQFNKFYQKAIQKIYFVV